MKSKYYRDLCDLVLNSSYLEFTRCYYSGMFCSLFYKIVCMLANVFGPNRYQYGVSNKRFERTAKLVRVTKYHVNQIVLCPSILLRNSG